MFEVVTLSITSFRGAIGGEHYYGKLHVETKRDVIVREDGKTGYVTRSGHGVERHPHDRHDIQRRLGAKEAAYLNKKDDDGFFASSARLKSGDMTGRFNDVDTVVTAAIEIFPSLFDDTDILVFERKAYSDEHEILVAPDAVREALKDISSRWTQEEWLMASGYLVKVPDHG